MTGPTDPAAPWPTEPDDGYVAARPNPFAGVPARDYATDVAALLLLGLSLNEAWTSTWAAWERVDVVLVTILSMLSLGVFYVARSTGTPARIALLVRALANVPYVVVVAVYAVGDAIHAFTAYDGPGGQHSITTSGLGTAVGLGLAGAALAASPRQVESDDPELAGVAARSTRVALWSLLGAIVVEQVVALAAFLTVLPRLAFGSQALGAVVVVVIVVLAVLGLAGGPLLATIRGAAPWRWVLVAVAGTAALGTMTGHEPGAAFEGTSRFAWSVLSWNGAYAFLPAAGALALVPAVARSMRPVEPPVRLWFEVARAGWLTITLAAAAYAARWLVDVAFVAWNGGRVPAWSVALVVLFAVVAVAAFVVRATFGGDPLGTRPLALAVTGGIVVVGLFLVTLGPQTRSRDVLDLAVSFGLPALVILALTVPSSVRARYAEHLAPRSPAERASAVPHGFASYGPGAASAEAPTPGDFRTAVHGFTVAQASDPSTDLAVLAAIVERAPELRPYVALNPSTYPDLLDWLAELHDPAVDAALAARRS